MRPARPISARSLRQAWMRASIGRDGPPSTKFLSVLEDESVLARSAALRAALLEIAFEAFKKVLSDIGLRDEDVAPVALVANAAEIAERAERIQGARDHRLGHAKEVGQPAHRMGAGGEIDEQHERHLPVGEVRLARSHIADQGLHPVSEGLVRHGCHSGMMILCRSYNQSATV